jgi:hypothetical protein
LILYAFLHVVKVGFNVFRRTCAAEVEEGLNPERVAIVPEGPVPEVVVLGDPARSLAIKASKAGSLVVPEVPEVPDVPDVPEVPDVPDVPEVPEVPEVPDVPDVPEVPVVAVH